MKTVSVSKTKYQCEFCKQKHDNKSDAQEDEEQHRKVEGLKIGDTLTYVARITYHDWGREYEICEERKGKIIEKNTKKMKVLVEHINGARKWIYSWRERWQ